MGPGQASQGMHPKTMGKEEWLLTARWESSATLNHATLFMRKNEKNLKTCGHALATFPVANGHPHPKSHADSSALLFLQLLVSKTFGRAKFLPTRSSWPPCLLPCDL